MFNAIVDCHGKKSGIMIEIDLIIVYRSTFIPWKNMEKYCYS